MIETSQASRAARRTIRPLVLAAAVALIFSLQGCATSLETFGLGAGVGMIGAFGLLGCAIGCH
ncbi:hypothetical protein VOM14_02955 [Paraburkholderia sp. MPAMCS5]|uniref:hypothetical protein n=1 Tax=Paraburkholderia sp. MPAMCS5 TaxID=3112563 RepID=UPI002E17CEC4|nr:hypothetical protein [Paraburkholderia sp. MPAMCS5]